MRFGIFDHLDDSGLPLSRHFEERLKLIEAYDHAGFWLRLRNGPASSASGRWSICSRCTIRCV